MLANSERNMIEVGIEQVKEIVVQLAPNVANSIIIDEAAGVKRTNYCYIDVVSKRVKYDIDKKAFHPREELAALMSTILQDNSESPYVKMPNRDIMTQIAQSPNVSMTNSFKNAIANIKMKNDVEERYLELNADGPDLQDEQPLYLVKDLCSLEDCPKCHGTKLVQKVDKKTQETVEESCTECQATGKIATVGVVNIEVKERRDKLVLTNDDPIANLKDSALISHVLEHSMTRHRTLTRFNDLNEQDYDPTMLPFVDELHQVMDGEPATEDVYYQVIPCVEFTYRDVLSGKLCKGAILDVIDDPELALSLTSGMSKMSTAMKDASKSLAGFFGKIGKTEKSKSKADLKRMTRLLIAITIADGNVEESEKHLLVNQLRDMDDFTSSEKESFSELLGQTDTSFLTDDDFQFHSPDKARETLIRMKQIAEADGTATNEELDLIARLESTL